MTPSSTLVPSVTAAQRSRRRRDRQATGSRRSSHARARPCQPGARERTRADVGSDPQDNGIDIRASCPRPEAGPSPDRTNRRAANGEPLPSRARLYSARYRLRKSLCTQPEVQLVVGRVAHRRGSARSGYRHRDSRAQGGAHAAFDETWTSPSLPRAYPIVPVHGEGPPSKTSTATASSTSPPASRSPPRAIPTPRWSPRSAAGRRAASISPRRTSTCRSTPSSARARPHRADFARARVSSATPAPRPSRPSIKLARYATGRPSLVAFLGGVPRPDLWRPRLTASKANYHAGFGPLLPGIFHAPYGEVADLRWFDEVLFKHLGRPTRSRRSSSSRSRAKAATSFRAGFLAGLRELCDAHGILLIADEVQSGAGRTGRCGRSSTRASSPTSCSPPRASPRACRSAR